MQIRGQILQNLKWGMANIAVRYLSSFVVIILLARNYSPNEFGYYQLALSYLAIFESFSLFPPGYTQNKLIEDPEKESAFVVGWVVQWIIIWILVLLICVGAYTLFGKSQFWLFMLLLSFKIPFRATEYVSTLTDVRMRGDLTQKTQLVSMGTFNAARALVVALNFGIASVYACSLVQGGAVGFYQMLLKMKMRLHFKPQWHFGPIWDLIRGGLMLSLVNVSAVLQTRISSLVLEGRMTANDFGNYQLLVKLIEPATMIGIIILNVNYSVLSHTYQFHPQAFVKRFLKIAGAAFMVSVGAMMFFFILPAALLFKLLGPAYEEAVRGLPVGTALLLANTILVIGTVYDLLRGRYRHAITQYLGSFLLNGLVFLLWPNALSVSEAVVIGAAATMGVTLARFLIVLPGALLRLTNR